MLETTFWLELNGVFSLDGWESSYPFLSKLLGFSSSTRFSEDIVVEAKFVQIFKYFKIFSLLWLACFQTFEYLTQMSDLNLSILKVCSIYVNTIS